MSFVARCSGTEKIWAKCQKMIGHSSMLRMKLKILVQVMLD